MSSISDLKNSICDGFSYNAALRYLPCRSFPLALGQLEFLRILRSTRSKWYTSPENIGDAIPARSSTRTQIRIVPGTWVWGAIFAPFEGEVGDFQIQINDPCTGRDMFKDAVYSKAFVVAGQTGPVLFEPFQVGPQGLLNTEIWNLTEEDLRCQLVILCAEPTYVIDERGQVTEGV